MYSDTFIEVGRALSATTFSRLTFSGKLTYYFHIIWPAEYFHFYYADVTYMLLLPFLAEKNSLHAT